MTAGTTPGQRAPEPGRDAARERRETDFWGHSLASFEGCLRRYRSGARGNLKAAIDALEPLEGARVLDFACGQGVSSCLIADRGAEVIGIDITPESIESARRLAAEVGSSAQFLCGDLLTLDPLPKVDRVFGQYALHHVDPVVFGRRLHDALEPGGWGAFVETTYTNPLLKVMRSTMTGRLGVARYGTLDERPLDSRDFAALEAIFGSLDDVVAELTFLQVLDRNVLKRRSRRASRACARIDAALQRHERLKWMSYQHVLVVGRQA